MMFNILPKKLNKNRKRICYSIVLPYHIFNDCWFISGAKYPIETTFLFLYENKIDISKIRRFSIKKKAIKIFKNCPKGSILFKISINKNGSDSLIISK